MNYIDVDGISVKVVKKRIKNMYLRIDKNGQAVVSCPLFLADAEIERFVQSKAYWLKSAIGGVGQKKSRGFTFDEGEEHTLFGRKYVLHTDTSRNGGHYFKDNDIVICVGVNSSVESRKKALAEV